jgi:hypothetical protein
MAPNQSIDGFYVAYNTGESGSGLIVIVFQNAIATGADPFGVTYDGNYQFQNDHFYFHIKVSVPPNQGTVQGVSAGPTGLEYDIEFMLPLNFEELPFIAIQTPLGPVNVRFKKLRELPNA